MLQKGTSLLLASFMALMTVSAGAYGDLLDSIQDDKPEREEVPEKTVPAKKSSKPTTRPQKTTKEKEPSESEINAESRNESPLKDKMAEDSLSVEPQKSEKKEAPQAEKKTDEATEKEGLPKQKVRSEKPQDSQVRQKMPVNFEGDELSGVRHLGTVELHSNVRVRQADLYMQSDQAKVFFDQETDDVKKVEANGNVRMSKKDLKTGEMIRAQSEKVEFDALVQKITLIGKATLYRGKDVIKGEVIYYDLKTGWLKASKVKGVVQPENQSESSSE